MKRKVIVLGGRGIGMIASSILDRTGTAEVVGFLNDTVPVGTEVGKFKKLPVVGTTSDLGRYIKDDSYCFFIAYVGMTNERAVYEKTSGLNIPKTKLISIIDPSAVVPYEYCEVGSGVMFAPLSQLGTDTVIGDNCVLLANAYIGHDSVLERFARIATNAVVGGNVRIGKAVHIGSNSTIRENVKVGDFSLVGAGSVVLEDVPEDSIVVGNPARILRRK